MLSVLKLERLKKGKRRREVARELGIPEVALCRVENGQAYVPPGWRSRLADYYGVSPSELWNEYGWPLIVVDRLPVIGRYADSKGVSAGGRQ